MIRKILGKFASVKIYLLNTLWILGEKVVHLGVTFIATIVVARYLGPNEFGVLAYATSFAAIFAVIGHAGLSGLVVQELVSGEESEEVVLGTTAFLKFLGVLFAYLIILVVGTVTETNPEEFWVLAIVSLAILFKPSEVISFWFDSRVLSKYVSISNSLGLLSAASFKFVLVITNAQLILFAISNVIQALVTTAHLVLSFSRRSGISIWSWKISLPYAKSLLGRGSLVFLGAIFSVVYLKVDQVMLRWMGSVEDVGIYAVAATLSELWYFIPTAIVTSVFPRLIVLRSECSLQYKQRYQQIFDLLFLIALVVAILVGVFAVEIIAIAFGDQYLEAGPILVIHVWSAVFIFMRAAFSKWIITERVLIFSLVTQASGAVVNVVLNLYLIPAYGGVGAAYATLVSYAIASYFSLAIYAKTRPIFFMMTYAMISPVRYSLALLKERFRL
jgi:O-antigen/teichoic acid export membrane protein